jgi:hypothetical protein
MILSNHTMYIPQICLVCEHNVRRIIDNGNNHKINDEFKTEPTKPTFLLNAFLVLLYRSCLIFLCKGTIT